MIENELLFLGLLMNGPKHGYEVKRIIDEELYPLVGLDVKSIYYPLKKMEHLGLISKDTGRQGRWPEKYIYRITPKGKKIFQHLIMESFLQIERPYFNIDLSLYFMQYADKKIAKRKLKARIIFLKRIKRDLEKLLQKERSLDTPHSRIILEHDRDMVIAEIKYFSRMIETLE
jgi:DNA-binding PadR family transcriptional regulator